MELELELEIWRDVSLWLMMRDADIVQGAGAQGAGCAWVWWWGLFEDFCGGWTGEGGG